MRLCLVDGRAAQEVARELGIPAASIRVWLSRAGVQADQCAVMVPTSVAERAELEELRRENQRLRLDREILRRALLRASRLKKLA